ncbi:unnamed protein product [Lampetra fluviatilis]
MLEALEVSFPGGVLDQYIVDIDDGGAHSSLAASSPNRDSRGSRETDSAEVELSSGSCPPAEEMGSRLSRAPRAV